MREGSQLVVQHSWQQKQFVDLWCQSPHGNGHSSSTVQREKQNAEAPHQEASLGGPLAQRDLHSPGKPFPAPEEISHPNHTSHCMAGAKHGKASD